MVRGLRPDDRVGLTTLTSMARRATDSPRSVAVVGGGIAGASAARRLADRGAAVTLIDLGRAPAGRMSTRRVRVPSDTHGTASSTGEALTEELRFDHGAPFFTATDERFRAVVTTWSNDGIVMPRFGRFMFLDEIGLGFESLTLRFVGARGMSAVVRHVLGECSLPCGASPTDSPDRLDDSAGRRAEVGSITVRSGLRALRLRRERHLPLTGGGVARTTPSRWLVDTTDSDGGAQELGLFDAVILAMPAPQAQRILNASDVEARIGSAIVRLTAVPFAPAWMALLGFASPLPLAVDAITVRRPSAIARIVRVPAASTELHGVPGAPTTIDQWVLQSTPEWAATRLDMDASLAARELAAVFMELVRGLRGAALLRSAVVRGERPLSDREETPLPDPLSCVGHRWTFAVSAAEGAANSVHGIVACSADESVVACGDWCFGQDVESAYLSGMTAADAVWRRPDAGAPVDSLVPRQDLSRR